MNLTGNIDEDFGNGDQDQREEDPVDTDVELPLLSAGGMEHTHLAPTAVLANSLKEKESNNTEKGKCGSDTQSLQNGGIAVAKERHQDQVQERNDGENEESIDAISHCDFDATDFSSELQCCNVHVHVAGHHPHTAKDLREREREEGGGGGGGGGGL